MNSTTQIKLGAALSYISIAVNILTGLWYTPWMVDAIGKNQYGLYTLANSVISLFLMDFGLGSATGRYLSKYNAEGSRKEAERFLGAVYQLYLLMDAVILLVLTAVFLLMDKIFVNLTADELGQFRVVYAIIAVFSVIQFPFAAFHGILTAYEKFVPLKTADLLYRLCSVGLTVIVLLLGHGLYALVTVHVIAGLLVLVLKYWIIRNTISLRADFRRSSGKTYRDILGFSVWVTVSAVAGRLVFNITPSILGIVADSAAIAVFGIVTTMEGYTYHLTTAISGMFLPRISRIAAGKTRKDELDSLFLAVGKFQYALNGLIVSGIAVVGKYFVSLWMGEPFRYAYGGILLVLIPGLFYNSLQIAHTAMVVENKVKLTALVSIVTGSINICLAFPLASRFGVTGACISICIAYCIRDIICHVLYYRELQLDMPGFVRKCYLRMTVPMAVTVFCGFLLNRCVPDSGWGLFFLKSGVIAGIYVLAACFLGLDKQERGSILLWLRQV